MCHKANRKGSIVLLGLAVGYFITSLTIKLTLMSQSFMIKNFRARHVVALKQWKNCEFILQTPLTIFVKLMFYVNRHLYKIIHKYFSPIGWIWWISRMKEWDYSDRPEMSKKKEGTNNKFRGLEHLCCVILISL